MDFLRKPSTIIFLIIILFLYFYGWSLHSSILANRDTAWMVEASQRLFAGGTYSTDFFENNPPWVLYFFLPVVLLHHYLHLHILLSLRLFIFFLAALSWVLSCFFAYKIFNKNDKLLTCIFLTILLFEFLILPATELGQRENMLFIFSMPYFLMMASRLENKLINRPIAAITGLLAGSVFILKPYFLISFLLIEIYYIFYRKTFSVILRPEIFSILAMLIIYATLLWTRHQDYLFAVAPLAARWHALSDHRTWRVVIFNENSFYCLMSFIFYLVIGKINHYQKLMAVLALALSGFYVSYLLQFNSLYYHILPAISAAIVLNLLLCWNMLIDTQTKGRYIRIVCFLLFYCYHFLPPALSILQSIVIFHPFSFFYFYSSLFIAIQVAIFFRKKTNPFKFHAIAFFILISFYYLVLVYQHAYLNIYTLLITCMILLTFFCCLIPGTLKNKIDYFIFSSLLIMLSAFFFNLPNQYKEAVQIKKVYSKLINFLDQHAYQKSIYFFSSFLDDTYPTVQEAKNTSSASRFSYFWLLDGIVKQPYYPTTPLQQQHYINDKRFFLSMVSEDINKRKPDLVFIDSRKNNRMLCFNVAEEADLGTQTQRRCYHYDYLHEFSKENIFQFAWQPYHYLTTIENQLIKHINPNNFNFRFIYSHIPLDNEMVIGNLYFYLDKDGTLKYAFKLSDAQVKRIAILAQEKILSNKQINAIKQELMNKHNISSLINQWYLYLYIAKCKVHFDVFKFDVYERKIP